MSFDQDKLPFPTQTRNLGERRLSEFYERNAHLNAMALALDMSILTAPQTGYADECLEAIAVDAHDLVASAEEFASWARGLAADWRAQRQEGTR